MVGTNLLRMFSKSLNLGRLIMSAWHQLGRAPRHREKPRDLKHRLLHSGIRVANEVDAIVANSISKSFQQETRRSFESFHLSACEWSSMPLGNFLSLPAQPPKQAFTPTLAYWLKCSAAGHDGYDIEWQGEQWRFHEHCEAAIAEADDTLHFLVWQMAMGIKFKTDPSLVKLGYRAVDAYAIDENGDYIEEGVRQPNIKMMLVYLAWKRPDTWGKHPKRDVFRTGAVLVVGECSGKSENSYVGSIRARKWKSISRKVHVPKA